MPDINQSTVLRGAFIDGARELIAGGSTNVKHTDLVFRALQKAMETLKRMPDPEAGWLYSQRSLWPEIVRSYEERLAIYQAEIARLVSGEETLDSIRGRQPADPLAIKRMYAVFDVYPHLLVGNNQRRDYRIMSRLAAGASTRRVGREVGCSHETVRDRLKLQTDALARVLCRILPSSEQIEQWIQARTNEVKLRQEMLASGIIDEVDVP